VAVSIVLVASCTEHCSLALRNDTIIKTTIRIGINWYIFPADKEDKAVTAAKDIPAGVR
jgi:hypothetical protein